MRHCDLGVLDGQVLLFGGPYSNLQATRAVFDVSDRLGIAGNHVICTGDVVAYCGAPAATVDLVRARGCSVVAGNCEVQLARGAADCGCGFDEGSACDLLSVAWYTHASGCLDADARGWMASVPDIVSFRHHGARYGVIHGGVTDIARFLWPVSAEASFMEEWHALEALIGPVDHVVAGHCGLPFERALPKGRWINAGVIGMPPHDGGSDTCFVVLEDGVPRFHRLSYDSKGAASDMDAAGLPRGYRDGLLSGIWPSEDVLPPSLRHSAHGPLPTAGLSSSPLKGHRHEHSRNP